MADLALSVTITRTALALSTLQLNDGLVYRAAAEDFMGGDGTWERQQVGSAYMDGQVTVNRQRQVVNEHLTFEVSGATPGSPATPTSQVQFQANLATLIAAMSQDSFTLDIAVGSGGDIAHYTYLGEAADLTNASWTGPRMLAKQGKLTFNMPRQPVPVAGGV